MQLATCCCKSLHTYLGNLGIYLLKDKDSAKCRYFSILESKFIKLFLIARRVLQNCMAILYFKMGSPKFYHEIKQP